MMTKGWFKTLLLLCWPALLLAASPQEPLQNPDQDLETRARVYWQATAEQDWPRVYELLSPQEKAGAEQARFLEFQQTREPFAYRAVTVGQVYTQGELGWVAVEYQMYLRDYPSLPPRSMAVWHLWRQEQQQWYPVPGKQRDQYPALPPQVRPAQEEAALAARVADYWQARQSHDLARIHGYLEPIFRERIPLARFQQKGALFLYPDYQLEWTEITGDKARVKVRYQQKLNDPSLAKMPPSEGVAIEHWVKIDDAWYLEVPDFWKQNKQGETNDEPEV